MDIILQPRRLFLRHRRGCIIDVYHQGNVSMRKIFGGNKIFEHAKITFGVVDPGCCNDVDERGNLINKTCIELIAQIDRAGQGQGNITDSEAYAKDSRVMEGHLVKPSKMPAELKPGVIGTIEFEDGEINNCKLLPVSQISWKIINCDRIKLEVGTGSIVRLT